MIGRKREVRWSGMWPWDVHEVDGEVEGQEAGGIERWESIRRQQVSVMICGSSMSPAESPPISPTPRRITIASRVPHNSPLLPHPSFPGRDLIPLQRPHFRPFNSEIDQFPNTRPHPPFPSYR